MGLVYSRTDSGLVLAQHGQDEAAVARALREHDPDLRLVRQASDDYRTQVWKVYRYAGSERPAQFLCAWTDREGRPLPLSFRLLDMVRELDRNTRSSVADADTLNAERARRQAEKETADRDALIADHMTLEGRTTLLPRGASLRMARDRARRLGIKV